MYSMSHVDMTTLKFSKLIKIIELVFFFFIEDYND